MVGCTPRRQSRRHAHWRRVAGALDTIEPVVMAPLVRPAVLPISPTATEPRCAITLTHLRSVRLKPSIAQAASSKVSVASWNDWTAFQVSTPRVHPLPRLIPVEEGISRGCAN